MTPTDNARDADRAGDSPLPATIARELAAFAAMPKGLIRPRRADPRFAERMPNAPFPKPTAAVTLSAFRQPVRDIPALVAAEGLRHPARVGNAMLSFVVRHPSATVLVDAAISDDLEPRIMRHLPAPFRTFVRPPASVRSTRVALRDEGLTFADVDFALATHLHWDHVSGLADAPDMTLRVARADWDWAMGGKHAPLGVVRAPLTGRSADLFELDGPPVLTFERSHDVFGDGSVTAVDLAGHTPGSVGYLLHLGDAGLRTPAGGGLSPTDGGLATPGPRWVLLVGDAVWHGVQVQHVRQKATFPGRLVDDERTAAFESVQRLAALDASIPVVASHDPDAAAQFFAARTPAP